MNEAAETFRAAYQSELQSFWSLLVVPIAFLAWRATRPTDHARARVPEASRRISRLTLVFAVLTMVDPACTGPLNAALFPDGGPGATLVMFFFVLLGDFRVLLLAVIVARPEHALGKHMGWAAAATCVVPIGTGVVYGALVLGVEDLHSQWLWMIYEAGFAALCVYASRAWLTRTVEGDPIGSAKTRYLHEVFAYSAAYYVLWLFADVLIVIGGLDLGWAVRMVPNQLYYAFWTAFVYARFYSLAAGPPNAAR